MIQRNNADVENHSWSRENEEEAGLCIWHEVWRQCKGVLVWQPSQHRDGKDAGGLSDRAQGQSMTSTPIATEFP